MKLINRKKEKGFALLFSVLVSSLLLTIGLSIFNIALKELAISSATERSIHAFYAADSGREFALYQDTRLEDEVKTLKLIDRDPDETASDSIGKTFVIDGDDEGPNFVVTFFKAWHDGTTNKIDTTIVSRGYDSIGGDRIERAIQQTY
jgi:hypothetical protein